MYIFYFAGYHGKNGPMKVMDLAMTPLVETFLEAGRELGYKVLDVNGPDQLGKHRKELNVNLKHSSVCLRTAACIAIPRYANY